MLSAASGALLMPRQTSQRLPYCRLTLLVETGARAKCQDASLTPVFLMQVMLNAHEPAGCVTIYQCFINKKKQRKKPK